MKKLIRLIDIVLLISIAALSLNGCSSNRHTIADTIQEDFTSTLGIEAETEGLSVTIPKMAIYTIGVHTLFIKEQSYGKGKQASFYLPGRVYEFSVTKKNRKKIDNEPFIFNKPITLTFEYEPDRLPKDRNEDDIFAAFYYREKWHRADGTINKLKNTIEIETMHNGLWTWGIDTTDVSIDVDEIRFSKNGIKIDSLKEAKNLLQQETEEIKELVERCKYEVEKLDAVTDPEVVVDVIAEHIVVKSTHLALAGLFGESAEFIVFTTAAGTHITLLGLFGAVTGGIYLGAVGGQTARVAACNKEMTNALKSLQEAEAIHWAFSHPDANSCPEQYLDPLYKHGIVQSKPKGSSAGSDAPSKNNTPAEKETADKPEEKPKIKPTATPKVKKTKAPTKLPEPSPTPKKSDGGACAWTDKILGTWYNESFPSNFALYKLTFNRDGTLLLANKDTVKWKCLNNGKLRWGENESTVEITKGKLILKGKWSIIYRR